MRAARWIACAGAVLALAACDRLRSITGGPVIGDDDAGTRDAAVALVVHDAAPPAPPPPIVPAARDVHEPHRGTCHRGDCAPESEACCENPSTGEERCVARAEARGHKPQTACSADGAWRIAMECSSSSECAEGEACCIREPIPGFKQTVCVRALAPGATASHDPCGGEESCTGETGAACAAPRAVCLALPSSRAGGHCVIGAPPPAPDKPPCAPCFGRNSIDLCVPLCADDQRCEAGACVEVAPP